jgi:hypothetical protein
MISMLHVKSVLGVKGDIVTCGGQQQVAHALPSHNSYE